MQHLSEIQGEPDTPELTVWASGKRANARAINAGQSEKDARRAKADAEDTLAEEFGVGFVAGLIIEDSKSVYPPYSAAYLIDGKSHQLICYKSHYDNTSVNGPFNFKLPYPNYTEHGEENGDVRNPISYSDACIGA